MEIFTEIKAALEKALLPFSIIGAIAFGSRVKGKATPYSDFDLLIVADGINPKRHRRGDEIIHLKGSLPTVGFDILLFTSQEVISNFKNHNPLFLDISEDGIIILDKNNLLTTLINETKDYIKIKEIKRIRDGWRFPVKSRVATYLSKITNKDFAMAMFKDGERDYLIAKKLMEEAFYDKSVYHSQQAIEKCIKTVLVTFGIFQKTHFVGEMLIEILNKEDLSEPWKEKLLKIAEISEGIEPEVSLSRYPGIRDDSLWQPSEEYEEEDAQDAIKKAEKVLSVSKDFLRYWFLEKT
ncbi:MAG: HEPN domain-containing protein [bacterium]